jgi:WD40 repeat protein
VPGPNDGFYVTFSDGGVLEVSLDGAFRQVQAGGSMTNPGRVAVTRDGGQEVVAVADLLGLSVFDATTGALRKRYNYPADGIAGALTVSPSTAGVTWQWRRAESERARAEMNLYAADIGLAHYYLKNGYSSQALDLLGKHGPRKGPNSKLGTPSSKVDPSGWDWRYLWDHARSDAEVLDKVPTRCRIDLSGDGRFLSVASRHGRVRLWNLGARQLVASLGNESPASTGYACLSADGQFLAFLELDGSQPPKVVVWNVNRQVRRTGSDARSWPAPTSPS